MSHSSVRRVTAGELTQLVAFHTDLPADRFTSTWRPVASGFLAQGLGTITLAEFAAARGAGPDGGAGPGTAAPRFLSRNTWPEPAYRRAFPDGLAADAGGGPVAVRQAGVFTVHPAGGRPTATARPDRDLGITLLRLTDPARADSALDALAAALPTDPAHEVVLYRGVHPAQRFHVAVTVHAPAGGGADIAEALRCAVRACPVDTAPGLFLSGRELFSLTRERVVSAS